MLYKGDDYDPWGKPGAGAPLRDRNGQVIATGVFGKHTGELEKRSAHAIVSVDRKKAAQQEGIDVATWMRSRDVKKNVKVISIHIGITHSIYLHHCRSTRLTPVTTSLTSKLKQSTETICGNKGSKQTNNSMHFTLRQRHRCGTKAFYQEITTETRPALRSTLMN